MAAAATAEWETERLRLADKLEEAMAREVEFAQALTALENAAEEKAELLEQLQAAHAALQNGHGLSVEREPASCAMSPAAGDIVARCLSPLTIERIIKCFI
jgi:hypothetical protein